MEVKHVPKLTKMSENIKQLVMIRKLEVVLIKLKKKGGGGSMAVIVLKHLFPNASSSWLNLSKIQ